MPITVIVGGQYGSEGKGKIAAHLAPKFNHSVRTGGPNAGHTVKSENGTIVLRHLPCAVVVPGVKLYLGAGAIIDLGILLEEIASNKVSKERLFIDPQAVVILDKYFGSEESLVSRIGSTGKGVGAAVASKVLREEDVLLARDVKSLAPYIDDVSTLLHSALERREEILLEGTQGVGLSLHHGQYPYVTSRDVTAGSLCGEAGLGPIQVSKVVMVVRSYPIRVAGTSGPLRDEITWQDVTEESGYPVPLVELTTVTQKVRRVGRFDSNLVRRAAQLTSATELALTFVDYIDAGAIDCKDFDGLPQKVKDFVDYVEQEVQVPVRLIGTGASTSSVIERYESR
ncbi:MAG: adenylosuccinate synthetase [Parvibaculum sp.]|uniref:adenylosuccinate synthetase n=1 Tax=Parvibaculum sp. TaxID=2024848 RepID=UPI0032EF8CB1